MLNSDQCKPDEDGVYFVDRDPSYFHHVMEHMRSGNTPWNRLDNYQMLNVREEFDYHQVDLPSSPCMCNTDVGLKCISHVRTVHSSYFPTMKLPDLPRIASGIL